MAILRTITQTNPDLGREQLDQPHFDSTLDFSMANATTNAELTITLKILFNPLNAGDPLVTGAGASMTVRDANNAEWAIQNWSTAEFNGWANRAIEQINDYWNGRKNNGKLWLQTPNHVAGLDWPRSGSTHRPNIWCRFRCVRVFTPNTAHMKVNVARLRDASIGAIAFRSRMNLWDSADHLAANFSSDGARTPFYTLVHEVGHCIGQHHVGEVHRLPSCYMMSQQNGCYGSGSTFANNVMGLGSAIEPDNALTWRKRIPRHFPDEPSTWTDWAPSNTRIYPRLISSIAGMSPAAPNSSADLW
jgi:hypothetical protein